MNTDTLTKQQRYYTKHRATIRAQYQTDAEARSAKQAVNRLPINLVKRAFHNIIRRTTGLDPQTPQSVGLAVGFTRDEFLDWSLNDPEFRRLYQQWIEHGYARAWTPSIDRRDDFEGYVPENC